MAEQKEELELSAQIDAGLGRYYAKRKVDDYFDKDGVGRFKAFCNENGILSL